MICQSCGAANPDGHQWCGRCRGSLSADPLDEAGTVVGLRRGQLLRERYELERLLGRGGMGQVCLARDRTLDLLVAIKVVGDLLARDDIQSVDVCLHNRLHAPVTIASSC
jgi:hypothetical protein